MLRPPLLVALCALAACAPSRAQPPATSSGEDGSYQARATTSTDIDAAVRYNVDRLNDIRARKHLAPLTLDPQLSTFARAGSERFARDGVPHGHMRENGAGAPGFGRKRAENQGVVRDGNIGHASVAVLNRHIETTLTWMMNEGAGGGHHDAIVNPSFRRVGIGIALASDRLIVTNDFSD